jgi:hypothetical protein
VTGTKQRIKRLSIKIKQRTKRRKKKKKEGKKEKRRKKKKKTQIIKDGEYHRLAAGQGEHREEPPASHS